MAAEQRFGVLGYPVAHSRSPQMHEAAYRAIGIDAAYQLLPVPPELFAETVRGLPASGFAGANVTIPHKHAAAEVADRRSQAVEGIGAANTLSFRDGEIIADNTDAPGLLAALGEGEGGDALVLGAGGTARAAVWALTGAGWRVSIHNRTAGRAAALADAFGARSIPQTGGGVGYNLIVNTTAVGMDPDIEPTQAAAALGIDLSLVDRSATVVDFVYRDGGAPFAAAARAAGLAVIGGDELLARQAALSFEIWFGREAPLEVMRAAAAG